jgi:superfamily II DNA or RNA helicase
MTRDEIQKIALDELLKYKRATAALGTGVGKTKLGLMYIEAKYKIGLRVLIVAPKRSILDEWQNQSKQFGKEHLLADAVYSTYISLNKQDPNNFDLVILDECHSLLHSHNEFLSNYNGPILGLTGTPPVRHYSEKGKMVNMYCPVVYKYLVDDAVDDEIINDYQIVVHLLSLDDRLNIPVNTKSGKTFMTSEKKSYNYWSEQVMYANTPKATQFNSIMRMKEMKSFKSKEVYAKKLMAHLEGKKEKLIVFANTQEQADRMAAHSYHSKNPESADNLILFKHDKIMTLSCVAQLSEGVNIPNLRQAIILHAHGNERTSSQKIGRMLRLNPKEKSTIHILCYRDTVDEKWVNSALEGLDSSKIIWKDFNISLY